MFEDEQWKDVVGLPRYWVSDFGRVYDHARGRMLTQSPDKAGYLRVKLWVRDNRMTVSVHRLVAFAFIGSETSDHEVNHVDGDKAYNYIGNLELSTRSENMKHAYANGLHHGQKKNERSNAKRSLTLKRSYELGVVDVPNRTSVYCIELNSLYKSTREAARELHIPCHKSISRVLNDETKSCRGLHFITEDRLSRIGGDVNNDHH